MTRPIAPRAAARLAAAALLCAALAACGADGEPEPPPGGVKVGVTGRVAVGVVGGG